MLTNTIEAQDIDNKIDSAVNEFITKQNLKVDPRILQTRYLGRLK